ncbi:hypothetical protein A2866_05855 [Candidatus Roizmanbacteria bacterium RIFCSPHIGHO2_01_FULL_39_8]|uniref:LysM domain-containing protein n=2 Tax=Candidatus Roizmaniibacteriota TaxID=1752723 RepID=A0A1F7GU85_9BACT|nr:MAG: hypothetical protein A2866_05855 [Candidatus Roizmanbacteria bacterium RIFCSPHIGHO2_01_FULL_39_8]OGK27227.1 MAG: hypothetical protein A3C28_04290 [Candidatus Roizmanbacteria bacterium RIFCSPHIGHO2_02_FULL_39_9]
MTIYYRDISFYIQQYLYHYPFLVPLGIIGIWRWSVWILKELISLGYKPITSSYHTSVSIVTPVYNENPSVFRAALASWKKNRPTEIIAVIDYTDKKCIEVFQQFSKRFKRSVLIVTHTPGKRPALADGIKQATSEIVALVDSDTLWDRRVIEHGLPPFRSPKTAGVGTYQNVLNPKTFAQKIFDIQLDLRYLVEYPFLAASGKALICLSGRTAFYRRQIILPMLPSLVNETFLGKPVISGDDKTLTYLVLEAGWNVAYQSNAHVYTPGMKDLRSYLKQRLRWSRNALRADIKAIAKGWPIHHPALLFFQIDKFLQSIVVILSPIYFFISLLTGMWPAALVIFVWWFVSRTIKMYPHLTRRPRDIFLLPGFVLYSFLTGFIKIYAFFTLNTQGWITRWDKSRLSQFKLLDKAPAYIATFATIALFSWGIYVYKQYSYFLPHLTEKKLISQALHQGSSLAFATGPQVLGASTQTQKKLLASKYIVETKESIFSIAQKLNIDYRRLLFSNDAKITDSSNIKPGTIINIPGDDLPIVFKTNYNLSIPDKISLSVGYDKKTNTILAWGRSSQVTLADISNKLQGQHLYEMEKGVWYSDANIFIHNGLKLTLDEQEVTWLKLESNSKTFSSLLAKNADIIINRVKITSWDSTKNDYDKTISDGRSFIMIKDQGRMDIANSELAYLGFQRTEGMPVSPYGVSWKLSDVKLKKALLTGEVIDSKFHDNYFGAYTFGATGMIWRGNEFSHNIRYGLDPHDDSNGFLLENNIAHNNGAHGIIFSKRCMYNTIRNNLSYNNGLHGIMLHEKSDFNIIENNTVRGNTSGVALWHSNSNIVRNNTVIGNRHGIRANADSKGNIIEKNMISKSLYYGLYFYDGGDNNTVKSNEFVRNTVGVYIKSKSNKIAQNLFSQNQTAIYLLDSAQDNILSQNEIRDSKKYGIYTKVSKELYNLLGYNTLERNRKNIMGK